MKYIIILIIISPFSSCKIIKNSNSERLYNEMQIDLSNEYKEERNTHENRRSY